MDNDPISAEPNAEDPYALAESGQADALMEQEEDPEARAFIT